jgi:hypothetical protein
MSRNVRRVFPLLPSVVSVACGLALLSGSVYATDYPITSGQRATAQQVAQAGVALSELAPNAPDSYTIKKGDTLWDISKLFLKSPWRWPELWGMNMAQIRNPHLIYPGQVLYLDKSNGRARLTMGRPIEDTTRLSPRIRAEAIDEAAIASVPMSLIGPFLSDAVVFETNEVEQSPRIVATQEGRVLLSRGETAYVRGDVDAASRWRIFREPKPLVDPATGEVLGFEARHVGTADLVKEGEEGATVVPATFTITDLREEATVGDRLSPMPPTDLEAFAPHAPGAPMSGQIIGLYGDGLYAGQNQIVSLNKGKSDGMERGHVLALWHAGRTLTDATDPNKATITLPDERQGLLFVFRVYDRVSYALILQVKDPVSKGDRFTQP